MSTILHRSPKQRSGVERDVCLQSAYSVLNAKLPMQKVSLKLFSLNLMFLPWAGLEHTTSNEVRAPMRTGFHAQLSVGFFPPRLVKSCKCKWLFKHLSPVGTTTPPWHHQNLNNLIKHGQARMRKQTQNTNPSTHMSRYTDTHTLSLRNTQKGGREMRWNETRFSTLFFCCSAPVPSMKFHPWLIDRFQSSRESSKTPWQHHN